MYVRENAGKGRDPESPLAPALCPSSALSSWLFLSKCASEGLCLKTYTQPQIPRQPSQSKSSASTPTPWRCSHTRISESVWCVCRGTWGPGLGTPPHMPATTETAQKQKPFTELLPHFPLKHRPTIEPTLGFCCWVVFGYFPLSGGRGGRALHAGLGTCPFPKAHWPHPLLQHMCTTCKVSPPSRKKELPQPVKTAGVQKGDESILLSKVRIQIKKNIILIII